jgi:hypothetical protein
LEGGKEDVFDADVVILEFGGFGGSAAEKRLETRGDDGSAWGGAWARDFGKASDFRFEALGEAGRLGAEFFDQARDESIGLGSERMKEVFDFDGGVPGAGGFGLGCGDGLLGVLGEFIYIHLLIIGQNVGLGEEKIGGQDG